MPIIASRLKEAREAAGISQADLAERVGMKQTGIGSIEAGESARPRKLLEIARAVNRTAQWLIGEEDGEAPTQSPLHKADVSHPIDVPTWPTRKIPVFGQAAGGAEDDGRFILNGNKVADVLILPGLEDVQNAYAVYVYGTSMVPAFKPGATVYVDPSRPIVAGDDVVVQVKMDEHEPPYGFVKEFVARRGGKLVLLQHNPPEGQDKTLTFPLDRVVAVHKVVGNVPR
ncbi:helix-turn-helix domain-containing protein [Xanthobacter oligotrophicus]|uniref:Helix-turn-helix domain-containing protein n=1 Tax=Xanthobacter oligotrophicus TaxID=2607286 RepID=A0ABW6ZS28_9HYPH